jgi:nucleotide-binding universal stress UspA family protein
MKLLVTLDGSHFGEAILESVARIARPLDAEVELLAVGRPRDAQATPAETPILEMAGMATPSGTRLAVPSPADVLPAAAERRDQAMARTAARLTDYLEAQARELAGCRVSARVVFDDDVAGAIVARARQTRPDLIAMATHGRSGISRRLTGSVCEQVIRSGVAPVLVLRP